MWALTRVGSQEGNNLSCCHSLCAPPTHSFHFLSTFFHSLLTVRQFVASFAFKSHIESRQNEMFKNKMFAGLFVSG